MKKAKRINVISLLCNLAILGFFIAGLCLLYGKGGIVADSLKKYTDLTAIVTALASLLMILPNIVGILQRRNATPRLFYSLRFISAVMSLITFVIVLCVIVPQPDSGGIQAQLLEVSNGTIFFNLLMPVFSFISFILVDIMPTAKFRKTFVPFIATLIYNIVIILIVLVLFKTQSSDKAKSFLPAGYEFFLVFKALAPDRFTLNIVTIVLFCLGSYVISVAVWGLNRIASYLIVGVTYKKEEVASSDDREVTTGRKARVSERIRKYIRKSVSLKGENNESSDKVYHISYHNRRKRTWKVKFEGAERANKVFSTQKEAIDFANELVAKNGGSIRVHSMVGKIRKE